MHKRSTPWLFAICALLPPAFTGNSPAYGCLAVAGNGIAIRIASEEAVIIWDAAHHREDFIRRATFQTQAKNFGFMVPTPTVPTLAEADPAVFPLLEHMIRPMQRASLHAGLEKTKAASVPTGVQVLHTQQVAGYQAVVLAADNTKALTRWLKSHGYTSSPQDAAWLTPYVQAHWKITAFKIAKPDPTAPAVTSSLVRMSFATNEPFFPYREPASNAITRGTPSPRLLRVFLLANDPMRGHFKAAQADGQWPGTVVGINQLPDYQRGLIARQSALVPSQLPSRLYLTTFEDHSSPRPGISDVIFRAVPTGKYP